MELHERVGSGGFDLMGDIVGIVRDAIEAGLIKSESLYDFDATIQELSGSELEDYLQNLWDNL